MNEILKHYELETNSDFLKKLEKAPIDIYVKKARVYPEELKQKFPGKKIFVCDCYVVGIENGLENDGGYEKDGIVTIDHHALTKRMQKEISSTNLAIEYVKKNGIIGNDAKDTVVVINHTDCDSVLSSAILRGILPPEERFGQAAIACDHTGEENKIGDLLQSLQYENDLEFSLRNLQLLLRNQPLENDAQKMLETRYNNRKKAKEIIKNGQYSQIGKTACVILNKKIDGELFVPLIPHAEVIVLANPLEANSEKWEIELRIGKSGAFKGLILDKKKISEKIDSNYGGRWNAGSNARSADGVKEHAGIDINPEEYAQMIDRLLSDR